MTGRHPIPTEPYARIQASKAVAEAFRVPHADLVEAIDIGECVSYEITQDAAGKTRRYTCPAFIRAWLQEQAARHMKLTFHHEVGIP